MFKKLFDVRNILKFSAGIIVFFMGLLTVGVAILGALKAMKTSLDLIKYIRTGDQDLHVGIQILDTLDIFLICLVFLIFTMGIVQLFIKHDNEEYLKSIPKWLLVKNLSELKFLLMQTIIVTLFIITIEVFISFEDGPSIELLYVPGMILLLSGSLALLMRSEMKNDS